MYPQHYPESNPIPPIVPHIQQPLPLPNALNSLRPTQLLAQPVANPNNGVGQPAYNGGAQNFPTLNPIVTTYIKHVPIPNTLIDQGVSINIMTINTMNELRLSDLKPTQTILELADRSKLKPEGIIDDVMVSLVSWEYPTEFMVIQPNMMEGHPMILGRPWLATTDAYISCRKGEIIISNGIATKKITLHPPAQLTSINALWVEDPYEHNAMEQPSINVQQIRKL
ncbi:unnamed protein product [Adineta steineri]|uniref:Reverse transcriptase domain-containing protein n=1 Tax=Adineta steineri TaxID=433720 RepID=A0A819Y5H4_9BILA|nr:unnamed protein product [Adineta steineri]